MFLRVEATERAWTRRTSYGEDYIISLPNGQRAAFAVVRRWAGRDAAVAQKETEIQGLERLVWDAVYSLQKAGSDKAAPDFGEQLRKADPGSSRLSVNDSLRSSDLRSVLVSIE